MFGLGWLEVGIILLVAVLIFGPKRLPELGGALGKALRGVKEEIQSKDEEDLDA
ncbi:twin-arginine translocase TatA/TatE family subunit [Altericista sp. CCNU0014]|uniref:twin-arginine translocase TatA/TatE family subunit n=1 Tax=Altericista sp. CCNU0014 TaxID=3082949 RepID=UPI00384C4FDC